MRRFYCVSLKKQNKKGLVHDPVSCARTVPLLVAVPEGLSAVLSRQPEAMKTPGLQGQQTPACTLALQFCGLAK